MSKIGKNSSEQWVNVSNKGARAKSSHVETVLYLYDYFLTGGMITIGEVMTERKISRATFKRYLSDIRCYLCEYHPELSLIYDSKERYYRFSKEKFEQDERIT